MEYIVTTTERPFKFAKGEGIWKQARGNSTEIPRSSENRKSRVQIVSGNTFTKMAYKGKKKFKRTFKKYKKRFKKKYSAIRRLKPEVKCKDISDSTTLVQVTNKQFFVPYMRSLMGFIKSGTTNDTRIGSKIQLTSLNFRFHIAQKAAWTNSGSYAVKLLPHCALKFDIYLFQDKMPNIATAVAADGSDFFALPTTVDPSIFFLKWPMARFKVLRHWTRFLDGIAGENEIIDEYIEFKKPLQVQYISGTTDTDTYAVVMKNNLYLVIVGGGANMVEINDAYTSFQAVPFNYGIRMKYVDA